jgi:hypothetical protein
MSDIVLMGDPQVAAIPVDDDLPLSLRFSWRAGVPPDVQLRPAFRLAPIRR